MEPSTDPSVGADNGDDVWEHEEGLQGEDLNREWQLRKTQFQDLGYRDGIDAGKQASVQEGFDVGYKEAAVAAFNWGVAKGALSAYTALPPEAQASLVLQEEARAQLQELRSAVFAVPPSDAVRFFFEDSVASGKTEFHPSTHQEQKPQDSSSISRLEALEREARMQLLLHNLDLTSLK